MPPPTGSRFQIYKVNAVDPSKRALVAAQFRQIELRPQFRTHALLVQTGAPKAPRWTGSLQSIVRDQAELEPIKNVTHSFVLYLAAGGGTYAVCGGNGSLAIQAYIQVDFGLDIVARMIEPARVRLKKQRGLTGAVAQIEEAYKGDYNFETDPRNWGRITKEILGEASKLDIEAALGIEFGGRHRMKLHGKSGFAVNRSLTIESLLELIEALNRIEQLEPKIRVLKGYTEVKTKADRRRLDSALLEEIRRQFIQYRARPAEWQEETIGISHPEMREFLLCSTFSVSLGEIEEERESFELEDVFAFLHEHGKEEFLETYLNRVRISGEDDEDRAIIVNLSLRRLIYAELEIGGDRFFAMDGKWYQIRGDFVGDVNRRLEEVLAESRANFDVSTLPVWATENGRLKSEDFYIDGTCNPNDLLKFHKDHVVLAGPDKGELCDILDIRNGRSKFLFLKKGSGTKLRELCSQARESSLLYMQDQRFIRKAAEKIAGRLAMSPPDIRKPVIVMLFSDHVLGRGARDLKDRLGTMVKVELVDTFKFLKTQAEVQNVALCEIPHQ